MEISGRSLITSPLIIDRPVDGETEKDWFIISGGTLVVDAGIPMFSTNLPSTTDPSSQCISFDNVTFYATSPTLNAAVLNGGKFLRVNFQGCSFTNLICLSSATYVQSYYFSGCNIRGWQNTFFESIDGAFDVHYGHGNLMEFGQDGFRLWRGATYSVVGCSFIGAIMEGFSGTPILIRGGEGITCSGMYFEGNAGPDIDLSGGAYPCKGVSITGSAFLPTTANKALTTYSSVEWGATTGGLSAGNSCLGRFHRLGAGSEVSIINDNAVISLVNSLSAGMVAGDVAGFFTFHDGTSVVQRRAAVGAVNTAGAGFRILRVPN
jgi:hypothetical protein